MLQRRLVPRVCVFLVLLMGAAAFGGQPSIAAPLAIAALAAAVWLAVGFAQTARRDPYDLKLLREIHEREEMGEEEDVAGDAGIVCPHCGNVYAPWMPVCPSCRRSSHVSP